MALLAKKTKDNRSMAAITRKMTLTVAVVRFRRVQLATLGPLLRGKWNGVLAGEPEAAYGNLAFSFSGELESTTAVANEGFLELRSNLDDPTIGLSRLATAVLSDDLIRPLGFTLELVAVLEADVLGDVCVALMKPFASFINSFTRLTGAPVEAVSPRLYISGPTSDDLYTFDITPSVQDPQRELFCRLKSRRADEITPKKFEQVLRQDRILFNRLVSQAPKVFLTELQEQD